MFKAFKTKGKRAIYAIAALVTALIISAPTSAYAAANPLKLTVRQAFAGPVTDNTFTYQFKALDAGNPMPAGSTADGGYSFTIAGSGSAQIGPLSFARPGTYRYQVSQLIGTEKPGYTYDKRVYTVEVYVDAALAVDVVVKNQDGTKANGISFENSCKVPGGDSVLTADPPVKKTVAGNPSYTTKFSFKLTAGDPSYPMPAGSLSGTKTIQIEGSGQNEFGAWSYARAGTYYYTVYEEDTGASGYTYDKTVYTITDTVKEENGRLVLSRVITNSLNKPVTAFTFINQFSEGKDGPITGDNTNTWLYIAMFAFAGVLAIGAVLYLALGGKRKERKSQKGV